MKFLYKQNKKIIVIIIEGKIILTNQQLQFTKKQLLPKGPFKYYVSMFLAFLGPPTYVSINSTVNQQKLPFSDPTHPLLG